MDPGTAAHQLRMDLLFSYIVSAGHVCFHCGGTLTRDNWSIEHKTPWLYSEDPRGHFFDPTNIAYSHPRCNYGAARRFTKKSKSLNSRTKNSGLSAKNSEQPS